MLSIETIFWTQYIVFCAHAQFAGVELLSTTMYNVTYLENKPRS